MGNRSSNSSKPTQLLPPPYEAHINHSLNLDSHILLPITRNNILENIQQFNTTQINAYETYFISSQTTIIRNINSKLTNIKLITDLYDGSFYTSDIDKFIPQKYISNTLSTLYMNKQYDFLCETYQDIQVTILAKTDNYICFRMALQ